jgi:hypothetical protein
MTAINIQEKVESTRRAQFELVLLGKAVNNDSCMFLVVPGSCILGPYMIIR